MLKLDSLEFNNSNILIINILPLVVLVVEAVVYYLGALLIMKSRTKKQKIKIKA